MLVLGSGDSELSEECWKGRGALGIVDLGWNSVAHEVLDLACQMDLQADNLCKITNRHHYVVLEKAEPKPPKAVIVVAR